MAADNEIRVLLTAEIAQLQAGMDEGAAAVSSATDAMAASVTDAAATINAAQADMTASIASEAAAFNAAVQAKVAAQVRLNAAFAAGVTSADGVAEAESALDAAMAAGAISAADYAGYVQVLDAAELEMAASAEAATVAVAENTAAMAINGGVARELGVMIGELARGNYTRLEGSTITLANRTGLLAKAFTPMGLAVGAAGAAVLAFGYAAIQGAEEQAKFNNAVLMTGGSVGASSGAVQQMSANIGALTGNFNGANEAMLGIVQSGRFTAEEMQQVGLAAVQMSQLTGDSIDKSVQAFVKLREEPVKAVVELNDKYHFLTAAIFDQIEALAQQGQADAAAELGQSTMAAALAKRVKESEEQLNGWGKAWHAVGNEASWAWNAMMHLGETDSVEQQIGTMTEKLKSAQSVLKVLQNSHGVGGAMIEQTQVVQGLTVQLNALIATRDKIRAKDQADAANQATQQKTIGEIAAQDKLNESLKYTSLLNQQIAEAKARVEDIHKNDPGSQAVKGMTFDSSGAVTGGEQWNAVVAKLTKQYGEHLTPAIHASGSASTNASRDAMNALEMQRSGTAANTAERIQADAAVLASATRMYGAYSNEQKAALDRMLADEKSYDASVLAAKDKLYKQILELKKKNDEAIKAAEEKASKEATAAWQKALGPINSAFQQSINGMIQGTQTFRQVMQHMVQSIVASYAQMGIQTLTDHIINEHAKTAASAAGAKERATIEATAAAQSKASDAATGKSQITSAAATGAAKAYQAIVGIPYVGPVLAPIAAGVAFAGIEAFSGMISSARGGWERVPFDGAMTELHKDEMVLPAHIANPMRQMAMKGGQGGNQAGPVHIHTTDPRGFKDMLRRNPGVIADAMKYANRRGHFAGATR